jgi:tetratricopeptide (TPR) repeat protein
MKKLHVALLPLLLALAAGASGVDDGYKGVLDDQIPLHRAIKETLALLAKNPNDAALHNDLGSLLAWNGTYPNALDSFQKAADLDRKDSKPLFNAGLVEILKGNMGTAKSRFKQATSRNPGNSQAWWMLGWTEENLQNVDAAVDAYKHAVRVDTSLYDVRRNPFAATTKLKGRVLLETYGSRIVKAALPQQEQFEDPARIGSFFQKSRPPAGAPGVAAPAPAPPAAPAPTPRPPGT